MNYIIRDIEEKDNAAVEQIIRYCLKEFGGDHEGTAWEDPDLGRFSETYSAAKRHYWVAVDESGEVLGGGGIGPLVGEDGVCELQKMYCMPKARGCGIAQQIMNLALEFAAQHYERCYLETFGNMLAAQRFYEKNGFERFDGTLGDTGHCACDVKYIRQLH